MIISGLFTCAAGLNFFSPQFAVENLWKLPFAEDYTIFIQHWGMMVLFVGIFMIVSAFKVAWRMPVLLYGAIEKAFMVFLYLFYIDRPFSAGFSTAAIGDGIIVICLLIYFWKGEH